LIVESHNVEVNWEVYDNPPQGDGATWYANYWTLSAEVIPA
jgi:hypothetical protein